MDRCPTKLAHRAPAACNSDHEALQGPTQPHLPINTIKTASVSYHEGARLDGRQETVTEWVAAEAVTYYKQCERLHVLPSSTIRIVEPVRRSVWESLSLVVGDPVCAFNARREPHTHSAASLAVYAKVKFFNNYEPAEITNMPCELWAGRGGSGRALVGAKE